MPDYLRARQPSLAGSPRGRWPDFRRPSHGGSCSQETKRLEVAGRRRRGPASSAPGRRRTPRRGRPRHPPGHRADRRRLCEATDAQIHRIEGDQLRLVALHGSLPSVRSLGQAIPITRRLPSGFAILDRRAIHVRDVATAAAHRRYPGLRDVSPGHRTMLVVPLLREDHAVGLFIIQRTRVQPFTAKQIALLRAFADQAAIAMENEALRTALEARNRELTEGLERETATGEILRIISRSLTDVQPVLEAIVESATRLCDASIGAMARFDGHLLTLPVLSNASTGEREAASRVFPTAPTAGTAAGRAILERRIIHIHDVRQDSEYTATPVQQTALGYRTVLAVPLLREGEPIGALVMWRRDVRPFSQKQIDLMTTFADQAAIAIENVRLFTELEGKNRDLTEALDQQTATSEILRVISSSPTDGQPVFDTIAGSAMRLCDAAYSVVGRFDGELLHLVAHAHVRAEGVEALRQYFPMRPSRATTTSRAILDRAVVHVPDVLADPDYSTPVALALRNRSTLAVPMLRDGEPIGTISVGRLEPAPFSEKQIELLKTFADQAVIAIENVRLFKELEGRNRISPRRWSSRPPPARSCGSSQARPPMCSPSSTPSWPARYASAARAWAQCTGSMAS